MSLTTDFYKQVVAFKAIAREWSSLSPRKPPDMDPSLTAWKEQQQMLLSRAIAGEADMEAILLKLVVDMPSGNTEEHASDLHRLALLRIIYRNLREHIDDGVVERTPDYNDPALWVLNSIVGRVGEMIQARAVRAPRLRDNDIVDRPRVDYLRLIAYRKSDYRAAICDIKPRVDAYFDLRTDDRNSQMRNNIARSFTDGSFAYVHELGPPPPQPSAPPPSTVTLAVENPRAGLDLRNASALRVAAERLFQRSPQLRFYLLIASHEGDGRIILFKRGAAAPSEFREAGELPDDLPFAISQPVCGIALLRWKLSDETLLALAKVDVGGTA